MPVELIVECFELLQIAIGQNRRGELIPVRLADRFVEDVMLPANAGGQRHHVLLAQRIDRRNGDLGEFLAKVVEEQPRLFGQNRHRRIVAHRGHCFMTGFSENPDHLIDFIERVAEQFLVGEQALAGQ